MFPIYDSIFLIRIDKPDAPGLMKTIPEGIDLGLDTLSFCSSCWPYSTNTLLNNTENIIFSFNVSNLYYHSYLFNFLNDFYEIIISTRRPFSYIFQSFLKKIKKLFNSSKIPTDPISRFTYISSLLSSWPKYSLENVILNFPESSLVINFDYSHFSFLQYDPLIYFQPQDCIKLWKSLFIGLPILILAPSADIASKVCFSIFSLLSPLLFTDDHIIWLRESDPRYKQIINNETNFKLICTNLNNLSELPYFKTIIKVNNELNNTDQSIRDLLLKLNAKILKVITAELDYLLTLEVYSDFIYKPFVTNHFKFFLNEININDFPTFEEFLLFEKTHTFKTWRKTQRFRSSLRNFLLSYIPKNKFKDFNLNELKNINKGIEIIKTKFINDAHVQAVLTSHEKRVKHRINKLIQKQKIKSIFNYLFFKSNVNE